MMLNFKSFTETVEQKYESIAIEVMGNDNNWRRIESGVMNNPQAIARALENTKKRHKDNRVRAVGQSTGRFYDMMA